MAQEASLLLELHQLLVESYTWEEMKRLAFAVGAPYSFFLLPNKQALTRQLILHLDERQQLGCLVKEMDKISRYPLFLPENFTKLPCQPVGLVQAIFPPEHYFMELPDYLGALAAVLSLEKSDLLVTAVAADTVRLLVCLPPDTQSLDFLTILEEVDKKPQGRLVSLALFDTMNGKAHQTWQMIGCHYPPIQEDGRLRPTITWQEAWNTISRQYSEEAAAQASQSEPPAPDVQEPIINLNPDRPLADSPIPPKTPKPETAVWFQITNRPETTFLPQFQTGDFLLVQEDFSALDYTLRPEQLVVLMIDEPIEGTIQAKPYTTSPAEQLIIGQLLQAAEIFRNDAKLTLKLSGQQEKITIPLTQIKGVVIGFWRPVM